MGHCFQVRLPVQNLPKSTWGPPALLEQDCSGNDKLQFMHNSAFVSPVHHCCASLARTHVLLCWYKLLFQQNLHHAAGTHAAPGDSPTAAAALFSGAAVMPCSDHAACCLPGSSPRAGLAAIWTANCLGWHPMPCLCKHCRHTQPRRPHSLVSDFLSYSSLYFLG